MNNFWKVIYVIYPPMLRILERMRFHRGRQEYLLGYFNEECKLDDFKIHLVKQGFENGLLAWRDDGEIMALRLLDGREYQYHIRIFRDGEIRGHYECSPEGHPIKHILAIGFENRSSYFVDCLGGFLIKHRKNSI